MEVANCPACGGSVHSLASKCKHCGAPLIRALSAPAPAAVLPSPSFDTPDLATLADDMEPASVGGGASWPTIVIMLAVFILGGSAGVLLEQWRISGNWW